MKGVIYGTKINRSSVGKQMDHLIGEKLLEKALEEEYGKKLALEPRALGKHGKPFFTRLPGIHYNISHSGEYVVCILAPKEVGIDIQVHKEANYDRLLKRMVPENLRQEILDSGRLEEEFFGQWALREAYIKWTGDGLSRELKTIPMEEGWHALLSFCEGYSAAVWAEEPVEIQWKWVRLKAILQA